MNLRVTAFLFFMAIPLSLRADAGNPPDVDHFIDVADTCLHFAGEWDSSLSNARRRDIERKINIYCAQAKKQYRALLGKYRDSPELIKQLEDFKDVDAVSN